MSSQIFLRRSRCCCCCCFLYYFDISCWVRAVAQYSPRQLAALMKRQLATSSQKKKKRENNMCCRLHYQNRKQKSEPLLIGQVQSRLSGVILFQSHTTGSRVVILHGKRLENNMKKPIIDRMWQTSPAEAGIALLARATSRRIGNHPSSWVRSSILSKSFIFWVVRDSYCLCNYLAITAFSFVLKLQTSGDWKRNRFG